MSEARAVVLQTSTFNRWQSPNVRLDAALLAPGEGQWVGGSPVQLTDSQKTDDDVLTTYGPAAKKKKKKYSDKFAHNRVTQRTEKMWISLLGKICWGNDTVRPVMTHPRSMHHDKRYHK